LLGIFLLALALAWAGYLPKPGFMMEQAAPFPIPAASRDGRWGQAIEYLGAELPRLHVDPFFKVSEADFRQSVADLSAAVPDLNDEQLTVGVMRIVASIGDAHTIAFSKSNEPPRLPLEMRWLADGLIVTGASPDYKQAVGARVVRVGDHPVEEAFEAVRPLIAADNEMQVLNDTPIHLGNPSILYGLGLIPGMDRVTFGFEGGDGSQFDLEMTPVTVVPARFVTVYEKAGVQRPLPEQSRGEIYWFQELPEEHAVYVQYNSCREQPGKPFKSFVEDVFEALDRDPEARLVLDVRYNGGGAEGVIKPLLKALEARPAFNEPGRVSVIIGRRTFSSALQNAITLSREYHATLVGEPTGGKPNHYGETRQFDLPNASLRVSYSTRYWLNYPEGDPLTLEPDLRADLTAADLLLGRDPALEAALGR
jgi:hypothetical protein